MKYSIPFLLVAAFWLIAAVDIFGTGFSIMPVHVIAKCLLMPLLFSWLFFFRAAVPGKTLLLAGIFFSWCGDVLLLFDTRGPLFFIAGLVCFLITHVFYIIYFLKIPVTISLLKKQPLWIIAVIGYGIALVTVLFPKLGDLKIPVIVYAVVICTMLLCSLRVFLTVRPPANRYFLCGAILFVLSDSILAINKFYQPFSLAGVCIMLSYCLAQYGIAAGFIKQATHD